MKLDKEIKDLANKIHKLQNQAVISTLAYCKPEVVRILETECKDVNTIEHTLDMLCEVAFNEEVLYWFKKLCRYYYDIDPVATVEQINFYWEIWDEESLEKNY